MLHPLEVKAIADGDAAQGIKGMDPLLAGQLTREEIEKAEADPNYDMKILEPKVRVPEVKRRGPRYTPVSKRQDRPNAILWLVRNHAELKDAQIMRLVGTTKPTIQAIRDRTHWNSATLQPTDPVTLGLCTQLELDHGSAQGARRPRRLPPSHRAPACSPRRRRRRSAPAQEEQEAAAKALAETRARCRDRVRQSSSPRSGRTDTATAIRRHASCYDPGLPRSGRTGTHEHGSVEHNR